MLDQSTNDMSWVVRVDRLRRPILIQRYEFDDGLAGVTGATRAVFHECAIDLQIQPGDNEVSGFGHNFRINDN